MDRVGQALAALRGRKVLLVGDLMLDAYLYGETDRVSREAPVLVVRKERDEHRLGGAANAAANFAALGVEARILGRVGQDSSGDRLLAMLSDCGADASGVVREAVRTPVKTRVLAGAVGTSRQQVLRVDDDPQRGLTDESAAVLCQRLDEQVSQVDLVAVCDYELGTLHPKLRDALLAHAARGVVVCVDSRRRLSAYSGATFVKPNLPEAEALVGYPIDGDSQIEQAGLDICNKLSARGCLLTLGKGGMALFHEGALMARVDVVGDDEVSDVTGAGDTVMAVFCAGIAAGVGLANAMRLANCAAGVVVTRTGAATASAGEIAELATLGHVALEALPE